MLLRSWEDADQVQDQDLKHDRRQDMHQDGAGVAAICQILLVDGCRSEDVCAVRMTCEV